MKKLLVCKSLSFQVLMLSVLAGCGAQKPMTDEEWVARRAEARYEALAVGDMKAAYEFLTPSFRDRYTVEQYVGSRPLIARVLSGRVLKADCENSVLCTLEIEQTYQVEASIRGAPKQPITRNVPERWVKLQGQWWFYLER